jgi:hypothetical protein
VPGVKPGNVKFIVDDSPGPINADTSGTIKGVRVPLIVIAG